ncbi:SpoIIE family protein phosphatase [Streptomyces sp. NPDC001617]
MLALYTDGLVESREQDIDDGIARLCSALAGATTSLDDLCDTVLATLPPEHPADGLTDQERYAPLQHR